MPWKYGSNPWLLVQYNVAYHGVSSSSFLPIRSGASVIVKGRVIVVIIGHHFLTNYGSKPCTNKCRVTSRCRVESQGNVRRVLIRWVVHVCCNVPTAPESATIETTTNFGIIHAHLRLHAQVRFVKVHCVCRLQVCRGTACLHATGTWRFPGPQLRMMPFTFVNDRIPWRITAVVENDNGAANGDLWNGEPASLLNCEPRRDHVCVPLLQKWTSDAIWIWYHAYHRNIHSSYQCIFMYTYVNS